MANDFVVIQRTQSAAIEASELLSCINTLRTGYELLIRIKGKMVHAFDDSDPQNIDWTTVETLWGLPAGSGADIYTLINGARGSMTGEYQVSAVKDLTETVG